MFSLKDFLAKPLIKTADLVLGTKQAGAPALDRSGLEQYASPAVNNKYRNEKFYGTPDGSPIRKPFMTTQYKPMSYMQPMSPGGNQYLSEDLRNRIGF